MVAAVRPVPLLTFDPIRPPMMPPTAPPILPLRSLVHVQAPIEASMLKATAHCRALDKLN